MSTYTFYVLKSLGLRTTVLCKQGPMNNKHYTDHLAHGDALVAHYEIEGNKRQHIQAQTFIEQLETFLDNDDQVANYLSRLFMTGVNLADRFREAFIADLPIIEPINISSFSEEDHALLETIALIHPELEGAYLHILGFGVEAIIRETKSPIPLVCNN